MTHGSLESFVNAAIMLHMRSLTELQMPLAMWCKYPMWLIGPSLQGVSMGPVLGFKFATANPRPVRRRPVSDWALDYEPAHTSGHVNRNAHTPAGWAGAGLIVRYYKGGACTLAMGHGQRARAAVFFCQMPLAALVLGHGPFPQQQPPTQIGYLCIE